MRLRGQLGFGLIVAFACSPAPVEEVPSSALCGANGTNDCPPKICDATLGCVDCQADGDCPQSGPRALPRCVRGSCVACATTADCASGETCWPGDHACHPPCNGALSCLSEPGTPYCEADDLACVGCVYSSDCGPPATPASPKSLCDPISHACVECDRDADCPGALPRCLLRTQRCVMCLGNGDCGDATPICDPETFVCRSGCTTSADCPHEVPYCGPSANCVSCLQDRDCRPFLCDGASGRCVQCFKNNDCLLLADADAGSATATICVNEACVQCQTDSDCTTPLRCVNGFCAP